MMNEQELLNFVRSGTKFAVGDMVIGNESASKNYSVTTTGYIAKVTEVLKSGRITIVGVGDRIPHTVNADCFDHYEGDTQS